MVFVDQAEITVKAGDGGRGCYSFAQPPYIRYPYPDGGDGGRGGDVVLLADLNLATLLDFQFRTQFAAARGGHGSSNTRTGKRGDDLVIRVPVGTVVREVESGLVLKDFTRLEESCVVVKGGRGGFGNGSRGVPRALPKTKRVQAVARRRARQSLEDDQAATAGMLGERRRLILELKLIADVGLIGLPNAGKSSLLTRISTAHPKVAAYPFTTRYPVLGVVRLDSERTLVACDIPGLIEGAHQGRGLGLQFLRHIERTSVLVHVVDLAGVDQHDPVDAVAQVNQELAAYEHHLMKKPQVLVANKIDLPQAKANLARFKRAVHQPVWPVSCATGEGIPALIRALGQQSPLE